MPEESQGHLALSHKKRGWERLSVMTAKVRLNANLESKLGEMGDAGENNRTKRSSLNYGQAAIVSRH